MNFRKGPLTAADFEPSSQWHQPPSFFHDQVETQPDFVQFEAGRTFHEPSAQQRRDAASMQEWPDLTNPSVWAFVAGVIAMAALASIFVPWGFAT